MQFFFFFMCIFYFVATTPATTPVVLNEPIYMKNKNVESSMFLLDVEKVVPPGQSLYIVVTPYSGRPMLYVSNDNVPQQRWQSIERSGIQIVRISGSDPGLYPRVKLSIDVQGKMNSLYFSIHAFITDDSYMVKMKEGLSLVGHAGKGQWRFYEYVGKKGNGVISATSLTGDADLCVTNNGRRPTGFNDCWKKETSVGDMTISYEQEEEEVTYIIGVFAYGMALAVYSLFFIHDGNIALSDAFHTPCIVEEHNYMFYEYYLAENSTALKSNGDLTVSAQTTSSGDGDIDMYMSYNKPKPNVHDYQWKSIKPSHQLEYIRIQDAKPGYYYMSIYGYQGRSRFIAYVSNAKNLKTPKEKEEESQKKLEQLSF